MKTVLGAGAFVFFLVGAAETPLLAWACYGVALCFHGLSEALDD